MTYAGSRQGERTSVGATVQRNGILGVQAETTGGATTHYERDNQGTLVSEHTPAAGDFDYAFDGLGSVIGLVNSAGVQRAAYTYDPYGAQPTATPLNGALPPKPWRYAGGYLDPTGLYHFGARYYEPATGRWTQQDSVGSLGNPADGNRYAYLGDDPMNFVDIGGFKRQFLRGAFEIVAGFAGVTASVTFGAASCEGVVTCGVAILGAGSSVDTIISGFNNIGAYDCPDPRGGRRFCK